jgi:F420-0:gamma-glutamyl ligase
MSDATNNRFYREKIAEMQLPQAAIDALTNHQEQCDMDGMMVKVSRQALDEVLAYIATLTLHNRTEP